MDGKLAITEAWWVRWRDVNPVRSALLVAHAEHWLPIVERKLNLNKTSERQPSTWEDLAYYISREPGNLSRSKTGKQRLAPTDFLAISHTLGIPVSKFFPPLETWIAKATFDLCNSKVSKVHTKVYAKYCVYRVLRHPGDGLDNVAVTRVYHEFDDLLHVSEQVEGIIYGVASKLEPILELLAYGDQRHV